MSKIFVSYSSMDKPAVLQLSKDLERYGFGVWLDEWEIRVGDPIVQKIQEGIEQADYIAVWLTRHAVKSGWVQREWQARYDEVISGKILILPLLAEKCKIPPLLAERKYADFTSNYYEGLKELLQTFGVPIRYTQEEIEKLIGSRYDTTRFTPAPEHGTQYRVVRQTSDFDEGTWVFWNDDTRKLEKWFSSSVRWEGPLPLTSEDVEDVREIVKGKDG